MFKLMDKKIIAILRSKILLNWPYDFSLSVSNKMYIIISTDIYKIIVGITVNRDISDQTASSEAV